MEKLASKLPRRMLTAAIRDARARVVRLQRDVDAVWRSLFVKVTDVCLWNALADQKDAVYSATFTASTC